MDKNQLFYGDNLDIMRKHIPDETVDLCYIDPPFNSKRDYNQIYNNIGKKDVAQVTAFVDTWEWNSLAEKEYSEIISYTNRNITEATAKLIKGLFEILGRGSLMSYLVSMTLRIIEIHRVLKPTGSFYLHCDPTVSHYLKIVLDAVFCKQGGRFLNELVWCYTSPTHVKVKFPQKHDVIFFYSKGEPKKMNYDDIRVPYSPESLSRKNRNVIKKGKTIYDHVELNENGKIPEDWWADIVPASRKPGERLGYPTQKPLALLERIIKASSNEGDVVLDAFCGCGTTVAVAERLNRKWIGIDITYNSISIITKLLKDRYGDNLNEIVLTGIPADIESAEALALKKDDRLRKEFEKWAVLTYSDNKAIVNDKKGKDYGIDGTACIFEDIKSMQTKNILFSVKSGKVNSAMVRDFRGVIERENAAAGIFITLKEPTKDMKQEAASAGFYSNDHMQTEKIKIVTIQQILDGEQLNIPLAANIIKKAQLSAKETEQITF